MSLKRDLRSLRILIVENNADIAENIGDYMKAQGHVIDCTMDGIGGLHLALIQWFDVTVLDIMRPGTDGLTYCWKLRVDAEKHMPVLMLSSHMYAPRQTVDKASKHP